jgi:hypothetical protein
MRKPFWIVPTSALMITRESYPLKSNTLKNIAKRD